MCILLYYLIFELIRLVNSTVVLLFSLVCTDTHDLVELVTDAELSRSFGSLNALDTNVLLTNMEIIRWSHTSLIMM